MFRLDRLIFTLDYLMKCFFLLTGGIKSSSGNSVGVIIIGRYNFILCYLLYINVTIPFVSATNSHN